VDPDDRVPLLLGGVDQHPVAHEAGIVHEDVEPAEGVDGLPHHLRGLREVGHVRAVGDGPSAERLDLGDDLVGRRLGLLARERDTEVVDHDGRTLTSELEGMRAADAAARSGDDGNASIEQSHGCYPTKHLLGCEKEAM